MGEVPNSDKPRFSSNELYSLWEFVNEQFQIIKAQHEKSDNHTEIMCLSLTANCLVDVLDEISEMLEPTTPEDKV